MEDHGLVGPLRELGGRQGAGHRLHQGQVAHVRAGDALERADEGQVPAQPVRDVAEALVPEAIGDQIDRTRQAALSGATEPFPLFSWHRALVSVEAALSELERGGDTSLARTWLEEGLRKMPGFESAQRFFAPYLLGIRNAGDPEALMRAIKALLDAEQY